MRKKSHISLAMYIVDSLEEHLLIKHKKAFYLGSILPDCKPSFFTKKHEIKGTFCKVQSEIIRLTSDIDESNNMRAYCRDLGQVIHYLADYFTFPHNEHYDGNLKDHCIYEEELKHHLRAYIKSGEAAKHQVFETELKSPQAICNFIQLAHEHYKTIKTNVQEDCRQIVVLCHQVVEAILRLLEIDHSKQLDYNIV